MNRISKSTPLRIASICALIVVVTVTVGLAAYFANKATNQTGSYTDNSSDNTVTSVLGEETTYTGGYNVTAIRNSDLDTSEDLAINIVIKNTSQERLEFSPGLQLKIKNSSSVIYISPRTTATLPGGPIESGGSQAGVAFFPKQSEKYELLFFPNVQNANYELIKIE